MAETNVVEVVKGLQQAAYSAYDGALDEEGKPLKTGLRREKGSFLKDSRLIDGFNIKLQDNKMILNYHSEVLMKEVHGKNFESDIASTMEDVVKFLKREYKKITGESVKLTKKGKPVINFEETSRIRRFVTAQCIYEIGGVKSTKQKRTVDSAIKSWLKLGKSDREGFK